MSKTRKPRRNAPPISATPLWNGSALLPLPLYVELIAFANATDATAQPWPGWFAGLLDQGRWETASADERKDALNSAQDAVRRLLDQVIGLGRPPEDRREPEIFTPLTPSSPWTDRTELLFIGLTGRFATAIEDISRLQETGQFYVRRCVAPECGVYFVTKYRRTEAHSPKCRARISNAAKTKADRAAYVSKSRRTEKDRKRVRAEKLIEKRTTLRKPPRTAK